MWGGGSFGGGHGSFFPLRISNSTCGIVRRGIRTRRQTSQLFGLWPRGPQTALYSARFGGLLFMGRFSRPQCGPHVWVEIRAQGRANLLFGLWLGGPKTVAISRPLGGPIFVTHFRFRFSDEKMHFVSSRNAGAETKKVCVRVVVEEVD